MILSRRLGLFALLVATGAATPACSSDAHDDAATSDDALIDAPLDTNHKFAVGVCSGPLTGGATENEGLCLQPKTRCTGTLVAPNLVLTAQHCVRKIDYAEGGGFCDGQFGDPVTDAPVRVTLSDSVKVGEPEWLSVKSVLRPYGNNSCADDVVLLLLHQAVPSSVARPVKMALGRSVVANPPKEVAIVGRGVVREVLNLETWEMDQDDGDLYRRIATNIPFVCATNDGAGCQVVDHSSPPENLFASPPGYFVIGHGTASGDSGSGVLDQATFATSPRVLGVNSAGTFGSDGTPNFGLIVRLDQHRSFLVQGLLRAAASYFGWSVVPSTPPSDDFTADTSE